MPSQLSLHPLKVLSLAFTAIAVIVVALSVRARQTQQTAFRPVQAAEASTPPSPCTPAESQGTGKPSVLRVASGVMITSSGIPIALQNVSATIRKSGGTHDPGQNGKSSEAVTIESGRVMLSSASLTRLLNEKIGAQGKVHELKFSTEKSDVKITGKASKGVDVPFQLKGPVTPTSDGQLQLEANVKAADVPGLAKLMGFDVEKAIGANAAKGMRAEHNTITFNPDKLWGLPVHGTVTAVSVNPKGLLLTFGKPNLRLASKEAPAQHGSPGSR